MLSASECQRITPRHHWRGGCQDLSHSANHQPKQVPPSKKPTSTTLVHLANASYCPGALNIRPATEHAVSDEEANTLPGGTDRALYIVSKQI
jgi:hypothetical protein